MGAVVGTEESRDQPTKALVGEAGDGVDDAAERTGQSHGAWVPEAPGSGSLALLVVGLVEAVEEIVSDGTARSVVQSMPTFESITHNTGSAATPTISTSEERDRCANKYQ